MIRNISRRGFLKAAGVQGSVFALASYFPSFSMADEHSAAANAEHDLGYFVSINQHGDVTLVNHRAEMGQGIATSVPQIIADELGADWSKVNVVQARGDAKYGNQSTGGSESIRRHFTYIRQMGGVARDMLEQAAANHWQVDKSSVFTANNMVTHRPSGKQLGFGELAKAAATLDVPAVDSVTLKPNKDFTLIGNDVALIGQDAIVRGKAQYAQDIQLPNMLIASIERPPVFGGKVVSFDAAEAKKVAGVVGVIRLKDRSLPTQFKPVSGVAVLATNTWAAIEGRRKLQIEWDLGTHVEHNSEPYLQDLISKVKSQGIEVRNEGDVYAHEYQAEQTLEAVYTVPYHHHMSMETPSATAVIEDGKCTVWSGTQSPQSGRQLAAAEAGVELEQVEFNVTLMGGAFGRKSKNDFTIEAVELAKVAGRPVKVVWSREDDVKHGFYHSVSANYCKAELNGKGSADYWLQRVAYPPIDWIFNDKQTSPGNLFMSLGFGDLPFELDNLRCEKYDVTNHLRTGWFRSVTNINNCFATGSFVDELAVKQGIPTQQMWHNLIGKDRIVDPSKEGFEEWVNYRQDVSDPNYALNTRRMKDVIDHVVQKSGADQTLPKGEGWGISYAHSFNSYVAAATKVRVTDNKLELLEMHTAIDCGLVITPDRVIAQMEGAMIMAISMALYSEITVKDGAIVQNNFYDYPVARIHQVPPLFVHLMDSNEAPGGVGEPGLPPVMPSITNAIFHASGKRIRDLPIKKAMDV